MSGRPAATRWALVALLAVLAAAGVALGVWQVERREWKHALVARVQARLAADPVAAPGPAAWRAIDADDAYLRVVATGVLRGDAQVLVRATTVRGAGYWVMTPMIEDRGFTVLINRGFVPGDRRDAAPLPGGARARVTGLLRLTEPGGGFLRANDAGADRWYSRDVAAIAASRRLGRVAPYFIDADRGGARLPEGGLTIVRFADNHLVYALTWFALAAGCAWGAWWVARQRT